MEKKSSVVGSTISLLKAIRRNSILFGAFLVLQGIILYTTLGGTAFNVFVVIGAILSVAGALEFIIRLFRQKHTILNVLLLLLMVIVLVAIAVTVIAMIQIPEVRVKNMMLAASAVAILNGFVNIVQSVRIEKVGWIRAILIAVAVLCIGFGVAYWATFEGAPEMLTRARGIIFILTGATDIWLGIRSGGLIGKGDRN